MAPEVRVSELKREFDKRFPWVDLPEP